MKIVKITNQTIHNLDFMDIKVPEEVQGVIEFKVGEARFSKFLKQNKLSITEIPLFKTIISKLLTKVDEDGESIVVGQIWNDISDQFGFNMMMAVLMEERK